MNPNNLSTKKKRILAAIISVVVILGGYMLYNHLTYVSTDNAQIGAHVTMLSSRVNGTIQKVMFEENQRVKAGDVLAQIDTSDYSNASTAAQAEVSSLEARTREAEANFKRAEDLFKQQAISRERYEAAIAAFKDLSAKTQAAKAKYEQAALNVSYTRIIAPSDGTIARKSVEPGQFVPAGQPLFGFVASKERWVSANLKETELAGVKVGNKAYVDVDAIEGKSFHGVVESISPSTGAVFSLLPPDNATGNFTKVVQRVPVRIRLTELSDEDVERLQAGLSATVSIRIR
ncbi:MAG: HlyD family secretion protein [Bdellovibrionia bacterium]